jgi:hypothetical protein
MNHSSIILLLPKNKFVVYAILPHESIVKQMFKKILFTILAIIAGYAIMIIGLYISQDLFFGGIEIGKTKIWELTIAGLGAFVSAFAGGFVTGRLAPVKSIVAPAILAVETMIEATFLFIEGQFPNPVWFDILSELTLVVGILAGGNYYLHRRKK